MAVKVLDYQPVPIDNIKGSWCLYDVVVEMSDGTTKEGSMQGDTHMWAFETFEAS